MNSYDLELDPRELDPLESIPPRAQAALDAAASMHGLQYMSRYDLVDEELEGKLKALGYLE